MSCCIWLACGQARSWGLAVFRSTMAIPAERGALGCQSWARDCVVLAHRLKSWRAPSSHSSQGIPQRSRSSHSASPLANCRPFVLSHSIVAFLLSYPQRWGYLPWWYVNNRVLCSEGFCWSCATDTHEHVPRLSAKSWLWAHIDPRGNRVVRAFSDYYGGENSFGCRASRSRIQ